MAATAAQSDWKRWQRPAFKPLVKFVFFALSLICFGATQLARAEATGGAVTQIIGEPQARSFNESVEGAGPGNEVLFQRERTGPDFHYVVKGLTSSAPYKIELGFAELVFKEPGQRIFSIEINGKPVLQSFDIVAAAGGPRRAIVQRFLAAPKRGIIDIHFHGVIGEAKIAYVRVSGNGIDAIASALPPVGVLPEPKAQFAPYENATGVITQDEQHRTWGSAVPFGGIGTGKFEILPNGDFANFTINNSWDLPVKEVSGTFLAVAAKAVSGGGMARILRVGPPGASSLSSPKIKSFPRCEYKGLFPFAAWSFPEDKLPLKVTVSAFSPMIPQNPRDSSLPMAFIDVGLENPHTYPVAAAALLSWEDINGRGGSQNSGDQFPALSGGTHSDAVTSGVAGVYFSNGTQSGGRRSTFQGTYFVGAETSGCVVTRSLYWSSHAGDIPWWKAFSSGMRLGSRQKKDRETPSSWPRSAGNLPNQNAAAICVSTNLAPHEKREARFYVSWHVPQIATLDGQDSGVETQDYATSFSSALQVAGYAAANRARLTSETLEWHSQIAKSNLPQWLKSQILNSAHTITANSLSLSGSHFAQFETPGDGEGMLGAADLRLAGSGFLAAMFPSLDLVELNFFARNQQPDGRIPRYIGNVHGIAPPGKAAFISATWPDITCAWILQVVRHYRWTAEGDFLDQNYPKLIKAAEFISQQGVEGISSGGSATETADTSGSATAYRAGLYLAALSAVKSIARPLGDSPSGFLQMESTSASTSILSLMDKEKNLARSIFPLAGDWAARSLGLVPPAIAANLSDASATSVSLTGFLPLGETYDACSEILRGKPDAGMSLLSDLSDRILRATADGTISGQDSVASPAPWNVLPALAGFAVDLPLKRLFINPHAPEVSDGQLHIPLFTPGFWAWLDFDSRTSTGTLTITKTFPGYEAAEITRVAQGMDANGKVVNERVLEKPLVIKPGEIMDVVASQKP